MNEQLILIQLENIWKDLSQTSNCTITISALKEINILSIIDYIEKLNDLNMEQLEILKKIVYILQYIYNNDGSENIITDDRYDILHEKLINLTGVNPIGSTNSINRKTVKHKYPDLRGTLDKVYWLRISDKEDKRLSLQDWMKSRETKIGRDIFKRGVKIILLPKWDGVSVILECNKDGIVDTALSRGDVESNEAVDLSYLFKGLNINICKDVPFGVKNEAVINDENLQIARQNIYNFATKRNAVSGLLNNQELNRNTVLPLLTLKGLQIQEAGNIPQMHENLLNDNGLFREVILSYDNFDEVQNNIETLKKDIIKSGFDFDGIVVRIMDVDIQEELGRTYHINNYEVAFKFPAPTGESILLDIEFQYGLLGAVTPVAKIKPLFINGKTVSSISLGSVDRFNELKLRYNDNVIIKYDIIPYLVPSKNIANDAGEIIKLPTHCIHCGELLTKEPVLGCYNMECIVNTVGNILNYVTKMKISNIAINTITDFVDNGILKEIPDLYKLKDHKHTIINMKRYGITSYTNIINSIDKRRKVFDYELLGSLGIRSIGRKIFKRISSIYYIDELIQICNDNNINKLIMEGIKQDTANKIIKGINKNINVIGFLRSKLQIDSYKDYRPESQENSIYVCFTKVRDKEFERYLIGKGVVVCEDYNKQVDILICKDPNEESGKIKKARKANKEILSLQQAYQLFKYKN